MKTAIILTGQMRTFEACLPTLRHHVFNRIPGDLAFFVATVADANAIKANLLRKEFPDAQVEVSAVLEQPDCIAELRGLGCNLPKEWTPGRHYTFEPFKISVHPQSVARQLWQLRKGWELFLAKGTPSEFDNVIRVRPDLFFHSFAWPQPRFGGHPEVLTPWWGAFGGVNDRFAILDVANGAAADYFLTYSAIPKLLAAGVPFHPESLIAASVATHETGLCMAEFSTLREGGELRAPEITNFDFANLLAGMAAR